MFLLFLYFKGGEKELLGASLTFAGIRIILTVYHIY